MFVVLDVQCAVVILLALFQVFLKYFHVEQLNNAVIDFERHITTCQKYMRGFVARRHYANMIQMARKCEADMKQLNDTIRQVTECLNPLQQKLQDEDAKNHQEQLRRAEEKRKEEEKRKKEQEERDKAEKEKKRKAEEEEKKRILEEQKKAEENNAV